MLLFDCLYARKLNVSGNVAGYWNVIIMYARDILLV